MTEARVASTTERFGGSLRLVTWNLLGAQHPDLSRVADRLRTLAGAVPDVVLLQEAQRRQAADLAAALGMAHVWMWKHWPIVRRSEGLAVLTVGPVNSSRRVVLQRAPFWSWRRRIMVVAEINVGETIVVVANVHLSPHEEPARRVREATLIIRALSDPRSPSDVVAGDVNDHPGTDVYRALEAASWRDCWAAVHGDQPEPLGASNWTPGDRIGRRPTQRLDYVFTSPAWETVAAWVPDADPLGNSGGFDGWARLSDHLPVMAELRRRAPVPPSQHEGSPSAAVSPGVGNDSTE